MPNPAVGQHIDERVAPKVRVHPGVDAAQPAEAEPVLLGQDGRPDHDGHVVAGADPYRSESAGPSQRVLVHFTVCPRTAGQIPKKRTAGILLRPGLDRSRQRLRRVECRPPSTPEHAPNLHSHCRPVSGGK
jgi:hypothetical protein